MGLSKREPTPQGVSPYRKGFVACLCAFRPQRSPSGQGIPICLDRGASGVALRSDRHQGGGTTEVLVCKFIAKLLLGGLLCEPLGIHGSFGGLGHLRGEATHHWEILREAAGTSGALGHGRLGLRGATAALRGTAAAWGTPW